MRVKFNQAAHLAGKDYPRGTHEVPDEAINHKFFLKLAEAGLVEDGENQPAQHPNIQHRQKALHEKIAQSQQAKAAGRVPTDNPAGMTDLNRTPGAVDPSLTAEPNVKTGKAQLAAVPGATTGTDTNPAGNRAPDGMADANPPDGGTGGTGGPLPPDQISGEGFGPKDEEGQGNPEEDSGPDAPGEEPNEKRSKKHRHR